MAGVGVEVYAGTRIPTSLLVMTPLPIRPPTGAVFAVTNVTAKAGAKNVKGKVLACKRSKVSGHTLVSR